MISSMENKKLRLESIHVTDERVGLFLTIYLEILLALQTTSSLWLLHSYVMYDTERRMISL